VTATLAPEISAIEAVAAESRRGLLSETKSLAPWLFYDEAGSRLFEQITALPEYYLTRTERDLFLAHADEIFHELGCPMSGGLSPDVGIPLTIAELGAGTAAKTGILLHALTRLQPTVVYQPIDISATALEAARDTIERTIPCVLVRPQVANYITESVRIERPPHSKILALYIGSSIGNFAPAEALAILSRLRSHLEPGDALLLGTDLAPGHPGIGAAKPVEMLLAAYDDAAGVTAAFNRNVLSRLNRELDADFDLDCFAHRARWNGAESRIEMHLESKCAQRVHIPANSTGPAVSLHFAPGETIHTENSYKFTPNAIRTLLAGSAFSPTRTFTDSQSLFAVTLAEAV